MWRACERFKIKPPGISDDPSGWEAMLLIAYDQIRQYEEAERCSSSQVS